MGLFNVFEILGGTAQYTGVLSGLNMKWPEHLQWIRNELRILRMDFSEAMPAFKIPKFDVRAQHILLTTVLPFAVALTLLILFKTASIVLWYCTTLLSIGVLSTGFFLRVTADGKIQNQTESADLLIYCGLGALGACLAAYGIRLFILSMVGKRDAISPIDDIGTSSTEEITPEIAARATFDKNRKGFWILLRNFLVSAILICFGLLITGVVDDAFLISEFYYYKDVKDFLGMFIPLVGWIMLAVGGFMFIDWFCELFNPTRRFTLRLTYIVRKNAIKIILSILMLMYIPMTGSNWNMLNCTNIVSPEGSEFIHDTLYPSIDSVRLKFTMLRDKTMAYTSCNFTNQCTISSQLCPMQSEWRLVKDMSISCSGEVFKYYYAGALLSLISMTIGLPFLFFRLISVSVSLIKRLPVKKGLSKERKWQTQCRETSSTCKSLFSMFRIKWKYYRLLLLIYRLVIISTAVWLDKSARESLYVLLCVQSIMLVTSIYSRPYLRVFEDVLSTLCFLINALNTSALVMSLHGIELPQIVTIILSVLNVVLPTTAAATSLYIEFKEVKAEEAKERQRDKLIRAEERRLAKKRKKSQGLKTSTLNHGSSSRKYSTLGHEDQEEGVAAANGTIVSLSLNPTSTLSLTMPTALKVEDGAGAVSEAGAEAGAGAPPARLAPIVPGIAGEAINSENEDARIEAEIEKEVAARKRRVEILGVIKTMDQELDMKLMSTLVNYMLLSGFAAFLSVALIAIGVMMQIYAANYFPDTEVVVPGKDAKDKDMKSLYEFAGYSGWSEFTQNCCCQSRYTDEEVSKMDSVVERWKCRASETISVTEPFTYKDRTRVTVSASSGNKISGLALRGYCSTTFDQRMVMHESVEAPQGGQTQAHAVIRYDEGEQGYVVQPQSGVEMTAELQEAYRRLW